MSLSHLDSLLPAEAALVVAFSGGLDSTVLLHQLVRWRQTHPQLRLRALHVHHGLSPCADSWAAHCLALCDAWALECDVLRVRIDAREQGVEGAARAARYQALTAAMRPDEVLLTAQHLDDQCETLLLALKRGSGPAGLAAMPARLERHGRVLLRPLLGQTRQQLETYAQQHQLRWIEDESNQDTRYDRNFLRQRLLPELQARWPHFAEACARSAALCGEQEQLLDELLAEQLAGLTQPDGSLFFAPLLKMSDARASALLRRWIAQQGATMPSRAALMRLRQEVMLSRDDAQPRLRFGHAEVRRYRDRLYWLPRYASLRDQQLFWPDRRVPLVLPQQLGVLFAQIAQPQQPGVLFAQTAQPLLRQPEADEQVSVRFYAQGYFHLVGRAGGREMKKLWQELAIPPWQRERIPLIYYNQTLVCAPGLFVTRQGAAVDKQGWQAIWQKNMHAGEQK
ncbi:tRNA lysidine(34) synthetase TilS [Candidatus Pantoea deserta]|uniref:tRNA(Ile)-lysidine synthase n=1 Tax=Candidatus Pantoea deserta TaxID=1869313 RepID=A0A3N4P7W5_9GAMM|nr:tRNA lysidine(34) synthetase TilS [Pantoea deserta]RPE04275.1 tRNA lysidine(34) synthetase TilS [Pantoea deserta]